MESRRNSSGTSSQDLSRCNSVVKSMIYWATWEKHQKLSQWEFYSCQCSMTFPVEQETMNKKSLANAGHISLYERKIGERQWWFIGPDFEKEVVFHEKSIENLWQIGGKDVDWIRRKRMSNFPCHRGQLKSKGHGTLLIYFAIVQEIIETIFRITVSATQLNLYGEVVKMCEEYVTLHDRSGRSDVVMGQSMVLNTIKTDVLLILA